MSRSEAVSTIACTALAITFLIVLVVRVSGCVQAETAGLLQSGHVKDGHGMWIKPEAKP